MTASRKPEGKALLRLADSLAQEVLASSDEEILAELDSEGRNPERYAAEMCARFERTLVVANKKRLIEAKAGVAAARQSGKVPAPSFSIASARARLRSVLSTPGVPPLLTLAARNESDLSDSDVLSTLEDLAELGVLPSEGGENGTD